MPEIERYDVVVVGAGPAGSIAAYEAAVAGARVLMLERDREIERLKETHGDFGSGYPSDEVTQRYIKKCAENGHMPEIVRKSWSTVEKAKQTTMDKFF